MGMIKYIDVDNKFIEMFNNETGFYLRSGVLDENGKDTGVDPFMRNFPQLLDIGIMGSCPNGKLGICAKSGVQCYQNGLKTSVPDMSLIDYESVMQQCKGRTFQIALGGRGDPNLHTDFEGILKCTREYGLVPNYTTSGINLTDEQIELTKKYCGAVAVSWYRNDITANSIERFLNAGIKTNIHYVLGNNTIDEAIDRLKNNNFPKGINAVIFLMHKPVGQGQQTNVLKFEDPKVKEFYEIIDNSINTVDFKIGFDSCNVPALVNFNKHISEESIDTCEAARYSAYITSDMKMLSCSFDNQDLTTAVDLKQYTVEEAWNGEKFNNFRSHFKNSCTTCKSKANCLGGCPIKREIVLCNRKEKNLK